ERLRGDPDARLHRVDVGEDAQDAPAVGGPAGKSVDVEKVIARSKAQTARGFLLGPITDAVELPARCVGGEGRAEPARDRAGEGGEDLLEPFVLACRSARITGDLAAG